MGGGRFRTIGDAVVARYAASVMFFVLSEDRNVDTLQSLYERKIKKEKK